MCSDIFPPRPPNCSHAARVYALRAAAPAMHGMCPGHRPPCISTRHATHTTHIRRLSAATPAAKQVIGECALSDTQVLQCPVPPPPKNLFSKRAKPAAPQICCRLLRKNTMRRHLSRMQVGTSMMLYCSSAWSSAQSRRPWTHPRSRAHPNAPQEDEAGRVHDVLQLQRLELCSVQANMDMPTTSRASERTTGR